jgi:hypothetical protein
MVSFQDIQTAYYMVAATGVLVAAVYYVINLRNTSKTHELQVFMQVFDRFNNPEFWNQLDEMMRREWVSYDDYERKYSGGSGNVVFPTLEGLGVLLKRGLIDESVPWDLFGNYLFLFWDKYVPIIEERKRVIGPDFCLWTEHLVSEVRRYASENHASLMKVK